MITDIVRWDPMREMSALRAELDRAFGRVAGDGATGGTWAPCPTSSRPTTRS
jgi:hypothetical protein